MKSLTNTVTALIKKTIRNAPRTDPEYTVEVCMLSDIGRHRSQNEDRVIYVVPPGNAVLAQKGVLAIVADGMGGHRAGQVASQMAIDLVSKYYYQGSNDSLTALKSAFVSANKNIFSSAQENVELKGMGTTCTALVLKNGRIFFGHVGDSRLYRLRDWHIEQMTEDHTLINELVKQGAVSPREAEHYPHKNIITRAMGTHPEVEISVQGPYDVQPHDYYLLCSDGLYDLVRDDELTSPVLSKLPHAACQELIDLAKNRGGHDNISVGIIAVRPVSGHTQKTIPITRFE